MLSIIGKHPAASLSVQIRGAKLANAHHVVVHIIRLAHSPSMRAMDLRRAHPFLITILNMYVNVSLVRGSAKD